MDFKWRLSRPGIELEFETGSIKEAIGLLEQEGTQISEVFGFTMGHAAPSSEPEAEGVETPASGKPGRKPRTPKVEAVAPAPLPVPGAPAPAASSLAIPADGGIPPFLQRDGTAPSAPPPPLLPNAPPIAPPPPLAPPAPPTGVLGAKVVAALEKRKPFPDEGKALVAWLAAYELVVPGSTYDEACSVVMFISDEKLALAAKALEIV